MRSMDNHLRGTLLSAAGMAVISPDGLLLKLIGSADVWTIILYRMGFLAVTLGLWLLLRYRRRVLAVCLGIGVPGLFATAGMVGASLGFVTAMRHTTVADALLLFATIPFWSALIGWLCIGERVRPRMAVAMLVALCGIALIVSGAIGRGALFGDLIALLTAISHGAALVAFRKAGDRDMTPVLCATGVLSALIVLPFAAPPSAVAGHDMLILAFLGFVQQPLALVLFISGARYIPAAEVALLALVETVLGPLWAWLGLGEVPTTEAFIGGAVVLCAIVGNNVLAMRERRRLREPVRVV